MSSNSATALATQQSIKAYVDSESGTGDFTFVGSTMSSPSNADVDITPGGTGNVNLNGDTVRLGDNDADATITTQGTGDLILNTNAGTNSGTITLRDGSNGDIILEPDGTGDVLLKGNKVGIGTVNQPDTLLHLKDTNAVITLQRTADANTPGLSFQQSGGNVRGVIKLDGTSGTSNEIFMQTYDGSSLAERFRVTHTGAKVSGTLNVDDGVTITDNTIKASASNADLELDGGGSGVVKLLADATVVGTLTTANITNTNNITTTQLDADGVRVKDNTITTLASNANLELSANGTGVVTIDGGIDIGDANISFGTATTTSSSAANMDTFTAATFRSAKYQVSIVDSTNTRFGIYEIFVTHDGSSAYINAQGISDTGENLATFSADINSGSVRVRVVPISDASTVFKFVRTVFAV